MLGCVGRADVVARNTKTGRRGSEIQIESQGSRTRLPRSLLPYNYSSLRQLCRCPSVLPQTGICRSHEVFTAGDHSPAAAKRGQSW
jgi:hypothetical protein